MNRDEAQNLVDASIILKQLAAEDDTAKTYMNIAAKLLISHAVESIKRINKNELGIKDEDEEC